MEFKRFELQRILRHEEKITQCSEVRTILKSIKDRDLRCSIRVATLPLMQDCNVLDLPEEQEKVLLFSRQPSKIKTWVKFADIEIVEVESNLDLKVEKDDGGRWSII